MSLIIIGRNGCPFCESAKQLMVFRNKKFNYFDINTNVGKKKYEKFRNEGVVPNSWKTVPVVLEKKKTVSKKSRKKKTSKKTKKNIKFIGGFNDLKKYVLKY